jgi:hypothetical protein
MRERARQGRTPVGVLRRVGGWEPLAQGACVLARRLAVDVQRHPVATAAVVLAFAGAALLSGAYRLRAPAAAAPPAVRAHATVVAYLRDDVADAAGRALEGALGGVPGVDHVARVAPAEALARMRRQLGDHARVLDGAEDGLLPPSLEVSLSGAPGEDLRVRADELARRLRAVDGVSAADVVTVSAGRDAGAASAARPVSWRDHARALGAPALGGAALALVLAGLIVLRRARDRDEIRLMLSLGFTRASAFFPAVVSVGGAAAGGVALGLLALRLGPGVLGMDGGAAAVLSLREQGVGLAVALALGALAGYLAARVPDPVDAA